MLYYYYVQQVFALINIQKYINEYIDVLGSVNT